MIAMSSLTYALRGEELLKGGGIVVRVIKLPQGSTKKGCAYGLVLPCALASEALTRLERAGIRHGDLLR